MWEGMITALSVVHILYRAATMLYILKTHIVGLIVSTKSIKHKLENPNIFCSEVVNIEPEINK